MTMETFVVEMVGRAVVAFRAQSDTDAQEWLEAHRESLLADLAKLREEGRPIWDGKGSVAIRRATDEECSIWRENSEGLNGDEEHDADDFVVFLVGQAPEEEE
jgi:hypothetical protein